MISSRRPRRAPHLRRHEATRTKASPRAAIGFARRKGPIGRRRRASKLVRRRTASRQWRVRARGARTSHRPALYRTPLKALQVGRPRLWQRRIERLEPRALIELRKVHSIDSRSTIGRRDRARRRRPEIDDHRAEVRPFGRLLMEVIRGARAAWDIRLERRGYLGEPRIQCVKVP